MTDVDPIGLGHSRGPVEEVDQPQDEAGIGQRSDSRRQDRRQPLRMAVTEDEAEEVTGHHADHYSRQDRHQRVGEDQGRQRAGRCHEGPHPGQDTPGATDDCPLPRSENNCRQDDGNVEGGDAQRAQGDVAKERHQVLKDNDCHKDRPGGITSDMLVPCHCLPSFHLG